jgi:hypothetical protein
MVVTIHDGRYYHSGLLHDFNREGVLTSCNSARQQGNCFFVRGPDQVNTRMVANQDWSIGFMNA